MKENLLNIDGLNAGYPERDVLKSLSFSLPKNQRVALIGPNGCGKSTLIKSITAEVPKRDGNITLNNRNIIGLETDKIIGQGIAYLRQTQNIFTGLTVAENLDIASHESKFLDLRDRDEVLEAFPALKGRAAERAGLMSGGERQALAVAMVLMHKVSLLLLDEPLAGLSEKNAKKLLVGIDKLQRQDHFSIILVEHRLKMIRSYVDRVVVMVRGKISEDTEDTSLLENKDKLDKHFLS